jgi:hypothetical protein
MEFCLGLWLKIYCVFITSVRIALFPPPMPIETKGGVVDDIYVEESDIDFDYIQYIYVVYSVLFVVLCS